MFTMKNVTNEVNCTLKEKQSKIELLVVILYKQNISNTRSRKYTRKIMYIKKTMFYLLITKLRNKKNCT